MNVQQLAQQLVTLQKRERIEIVRFLLFLDDNTSSTDIESEWDNEIMDRVRAVDEGTAIGLDYQKVMEDIEKKYEYNNS
ncbi:Addiction module component, CHP02574 [Candidatus Magnetomorum sp. HK-1]|nr:Addiction module component, CHP02574 [Candidatus Magnetomorum sp. HK-1]